MVPEHSAWLSAAGGQGVAGSNPVSPTAEWFVQVRPCVGLFFAILLGLIWSSMPLIEPLTVLEPLTGLSERVAVKGQRRVA
jgi:hypothetical protein